MTSISNRGRTGGVTLALASFCLFGFMAACEQRQENAQQERGDIQEQREEIAEEQRDVAEAQQKLNEMQRQGRQEWQVDYLGFKREMVDELAQNEKLILEKREEMATADEQVQARVKSTIDQAEQQNQQLRDQLDNITDQGDENWNHFKEDFRNQANQIEQNLEGLDIGGDNTDTENPNNG